MRQTIGFSQFCDAFSDTYKDNFSYKGKRALYDYIVELEEDTGEEIELDTVALCCEYTEYDSAMDCIKDAGYPFTFETDDNATDEEKEAAALEWLRDRTQVIEFDGGIIILDF